jgi:hypothetical protein
LVKRALKRVFVHRRAYKASEARSSIYSSTLRKLATLEPKLTDRLEQLFRRLNNRWSHSVRNSTFVSESSPENGISPPRFVQVEMMSSAKIKAELVSDLFTKPNWRRSTLCVPGRNDFCCEQAGRERLADSLTRERIVGACGVANRKPTWSCQRRRHRTSRRDDK